MSPSLRCAFSVASEDWSGVDRHLALPSLKGGEFAVGLGDEKGRSLSAGPLLPDGSLALFLDPLTSRLPSFADSPAKVDLSLDSKLWGAALGGGRVGAFAIEKRAIGTDAEVDFFPESATAEKKPPRFAAAGLRAAFPLGTSLGGLVLGLGRSGAGGTPSSWYDAPVSGAWPRGLAALFLDSPHGNPRIESALAFSSAIDKGSGLALRIAVEEGVEGRVLQLFFAVRSPRFFSPDEDEDLLGRSWAELSGDIGNGLSLGIRGTIEARVSATDPTPRLSRKFRLRLEGESEDVRLPLSLRFDGDWESAVDAAALGNQADLRWSLKPGLGLGFKAFSRFEWSGEEAGIFHGGWSSSVFFPPALLRWGLETSLDLPLPGLHIPLSLLFRGTIEREKPFAAQCPEPYLSRLGLALGFSPIERVGLSLRVDAEGKRAPSPIASIGRASVAVAASILVRLEL